MSADGEKNYLGAAGAHTAISREGSVVTIAITCGTDDEAQAIYHKMVSDIKSSGTFMLAMRQSKRGPAS